MSIPVQKSRRVQIPGRQHTINAEKSIHIPRIIRITETKPPQGSTTLMRGRDVHRRHPHIGGHQLQNLSNIIRARRRNIHRHIHKTLKQPVHVTPGRRPIPPRPRLVTDVRAHKHAVRNTSQPRPERGRTKHHINRHTTHSAQTAVRNREARQMSAHSTNHKEGKGPSPRQGV